MQVLNEWLSAMSIRLYWRRSSSVVFAQSTLGAEEDRLRRQSAPDVLLQTKAAVVDSACFSSARLPWSFSTLSTAPLTIHQG
jgi:hypothetical protein